MTSHASDPEGLRLGRRLDQAATSVMNAYAADLPPLRWSLSPDGWLRGTTGYGHQYSDTAAAEATARWAERLDLRRMRETPYPRGTVEYKGDVDGRHIEVWGVVDRDMFRKEHHADPADPADANGRAR